MHLEGSIEPELMLELAARNGMKLRWDTAHELRAAYQFSNLQSFLDLYFEGCRVLVQEQDFYDVTRAYLRRAHEDGVIRAELFLGPQSFTERGVGIAAVMNGVLRAIDDGVREHGISVGFLVSAHRHRSEADALSLLDQVQPWSDRIAGIGMGGAEVGNPPSKFVDFFRACREQGFRTTIHAGEEGPASYVREAMELLGVDRIDHGIACMDDPGLVRELAARKNSADRLPLVERQAEDGCVTGAAPAQGDDGCGAARYRELRRPAVLWRLRQREHDRVPACTGPSIDQLVSWDGSIEAAFVTPR